MARLLFLALLLAPTGCFTIPARPRLMRALHLELEDVRAADDGELPYAPRKLEDPSPAVGMSRADVEGDLGPAECRELETGSRCRYRFFARHGGATGPYLELTYDAKDRCTAARWLPGG